MIIPGLQLTRKDSPQPHMKHDDLVNLSEEHREVSQGFSIDPSDKEANERQV